MNYFICLLFVFFSTSLFALPIDIEKANKFIKNTGNIIDEDPNWSRDEWNSEEEFYFKCKKYISEYEAWNRYTYLCWLNFQYPLEKEFYKYIIFENEIVFYDKNFQRIGFYEKTKIKHLKINKYFDNLLCESEEIDINSGEIIISDKKQKFDLAQILGIDTTTKKGQQKLKKIQRYLS